MKRGGSAGVKRYRKIAGAQPGQIVHHVDGNPMNNDPENLQLMTQSEHAKLHQTGRRWKRPPYLICPGCGEEFENPTTGRVRKYCSPECYQTTLKGKGNPNYRHGKNVREGR
jgi:HNH endonuclease